MYILHTYDLWFIGGGSRISGERNVIVNVRHGGKEVGKGE